VSRFHVVKYPDPVLRKKAAPVEKISPEILAFLDEMGELMYDSNGVGLAAPQVGISLRIIVVDVGEKLHYLINPVIVAREGEQTGIEGCLSFPGLHGEVTRAQRVEIRAINRRGKKISLSGEGMWARAMQHEIDHLDGILFVDHVLPETLHWVADAPDAAGEYLERPTSLDEALQVFERQHVLTVR
jgi:peptide deformylase